jgi:hypothetical protein
MSGKHIVINAFDTCVWDPGGDPWRALCHHEDEAEDGLSDCETAAPSLRAPTPTATGVNSTTTPKSILQARAAGRSIGKLALP